MANELIARLAKAAGEDRKLDAAISVAVDDWAAQEPALAPFYTRSIDHAFMLIDFRRMTLSLSIGAINLAFVTVLNDDALVQPLSFEGSASTPALAICIAALRAKDSQ